MRGERERKARLRLCFAARMQQAVARGVIEAVVVSAEQVWPVHARQPV